MQTHKKHTDTARNDETEYVTEKDENTDDITETEDESYTPEQKIKQLRDKYKQCDAEKRQILEDLQRARAEFLNSRRMLEEQFKRDKERTTERHIEEILPLADSFDMAMQGPLWESSDEVWRKGIEGIRAQLNAILVQNGVTVINEIHIPFNPHEHEAVSEIDSEEEKPNTILQVIQKGYKRNGFIIRPAKVVISA